MIGKENAPQKQNLEQLEQSVRELEMALAELRANRGAPQEDLERQLQAERAAHAADRAALNELRSRMELEDQTVAEMRDALRKKLEEMNERDRQDELDRQAARKAFQAEMDAKRALLDQELEQYREKEMANLRQQVQAFWGCYNAYLSQIQQAVEQLNKTALTVGQAAFDQNTDVAAMFQGLMGGPFPFGKGEPAGEEAEEQEEPAPPEISPAEWYASAPGPVSAESAEGEEVQEDKESEKSEKSERAAEKVFRFEYPESSEQTESPKSKTDSEDGKDFSLKTVPLGTVRPFIVREDAPAKMTK